MQRSQLSKLPFQKHLVGTLALMVLGFNFTKRYMTFPHPHKDDSKPMLLLNGDLHPFEKQPPVSLIEVMNLIIIISGCRDSRKTLHSAQPTVIEEAAMLSLRQYI